MMRGSRLVVHAGVWFWSLLYIFLVLFHCHQGNFMSYCPSVNLAWLPRCAIKQPRRLWANWPQKSSEDDDINTAKRTTNRVLYWLFCMQQVRTNVLMADDTAELSTGQNVLSDGQKTICVIDYIYEIRLKTNHINNSNLALCDGRTNDISWDWKWISDGFHVPRRSAGLSVLEPKYCHFDAKFVNACAGSFQDDNLLVHLVM